MSAKVAKSVKEKIPKQKLLQKAKIDAQSNGSKNQTSSENRTIERYNTGNDELDQKIIQVTELTGCTSDQAYSALYDFDGDINRAVDKLLEKHDTQDEWQEIGKKKKTAVSNNNNNNSHSVVQPIQTTTIRPQGVNRSERSTYTSNGEGGGESYGVRGGVGRGAVAPRFQQPRGRGRGFGSVSNGNEQFCDRPGDVNRERGNDWSANRETSHRGGRRDASGLGSGRGEDGRAAAQNITDAIEMWSSERVAVSNGHIVKDSTIGAWSDATEDCAADEWVGSLEESRVFMPSKSTPPPIAQQSTILTPTQSANIPPLSAVHQSSAKRSLVYNVESPSNTPPTTAGFQPPMFGQTSSNGYVGGEVLYSAGAGVGRYPLGLRGHEQRPTQGYNIQGADMLPESLVRVNDGRPETYATVGDLNRAAREAEHCIKASLGMISSSAGVSGLNNEVHLPTVASGAAAVSFSSQQRQLRAKLSAPSKIPSLAVEMPGLMTVPQLDVQFGNWDLGTSPARRSASPGSEFRLPATPQKQSPYAANNKYPDGSVNVTGVSSSATTTSSNVTPSASVSINRFTNNDNISSSVVAPSNGVTSSRSVTTMHQVPHSIEQITTEVVKSNASVVTSVSDPQLLTYSTARSGADVRKDTSFTAQSGNESTAHQQQLPSSFNQMINIPANSTPAGYPVSETHSDTPANLGTESSPQSQRNQYTSRHQNYQPRSGPVNPQRTMDFRDYSHAPEQMKYMTSEYPVDSQASNVSMERHSNNSNGSRSGDVSAISNVNESTTGYNGNHQDESKSGHSQSGSNVKETVSQGAGYNNASQTSSYNAGQSMTESSYERRQQQSNGFNVQQPQPINYQGMRSVSDQRSYESESKITGSQYEVTDNRQHADQLTSNTAFLNQAGNRQHRITNPYINPSDNRQQVNQVDSRQQLNQADNRQQVNQADNRQQLSQADNRQQVTTAAYANQIDNRQNVTTDPYTNQMNNRQHVTNASYSNLADSRQQAASIAYTSAGTVEKSLSDGSYLSSSTSSLQKAQQLNNVPSHTYGTSIVQEPSDNGRHMNTVHHSAVGGYNQGNEQSFMGGNQYSSGDRVALHPSHYYPQNQSESMGYRHRGDQFSTRDTGNGDYRSGGEQSAPQSVVNGGQGLNTRAMPQNGNSKSTYGEQTVATSSQAVGSTENGSRHHNGADNSRNVTLNNASSSGVNVSGGVTVLSSSASVSTGSSVALTSNTPKLSVITTFKSSTSVPSKGLVSLPTHGVPAAAVVNNSYMVGQPPGFPVSAYGYLPSAPPQHPGLSFGAGSGAPGLSFGAGAGASGLPYGAGGAYSYEDMQMMSRRLQMPGNYYDIPSAQATAPQSARTNVTSHVNIASHVEQIYSGSNSRMTAVDPLSPVNALPSQAPVLPGSGNQSGYPAMPPGSFYYYPSNAGLVPYYAPMMPVPGVTAVTNPAAHGGVSAATTQYPSSALYGSHHYGTSSSQEYAKTYGPSSGKGSTVNSVGGAANDMMMGANGFSKAHGPFEKTGYNGTTPPPFGMATLPHGSQPGVAGQQAMYPFVLPHQSQLQQHHVMSQDSMMTGRVQSKPASNKGYGGSNTHWGGN